MVEKKEMILYDMREHLYEIVAKRMENALDAYSNKKYAICFSEMNAIKTIISCEMDADTKVLFDRASQQIRVAVEIAYEGRVRTQKDLRDKNQLLAELPNTIEFYMEMVFGEMNSQGIWFPKGIRYDSFETTMMQETFGINPESKKKKLETLRKLDKEEIFSLMTKNNVEDLYARWVMKNVLQV